MKQIFRATAIVIMIKAGVSPQSPPPAYFAVAFQGFAGALLFHFLPFKIAAIGLGVTSMVESALQKVITATIIYGNSIWAAINLFFKSIVKDLHLPGDISFSAGIIIAYTTLYAAWGLVLGLWMIKLPKQIEAKAKAIRGQIIVPATSTSLPTKKRTGKLATSLIILAAIVSVFLMGNNWNKATYVIFRTIAVIAVFIWVINPIFRWLLRRWATKPSLSKARAIQDAMSLLPELRSFVRPAFRLAAAEHKGIKKLKAFVLILIVLSIYPPDREQ